MQETPELVTLSKELIFVVGSQAERYPYQRLQLAEELYSLKSIQKQEALRSLGS